MIQSIRLYKLPSIFLETVRIVKINTPTLYILLPGPLYVLSILTGPTEAGPQESTLANTVISLIIQIPK